MTLTDYLIDISLIALVLFQVKGRRITARGLLLPVGIVTYVAFSYLRGIPIAGNDLVLVLGCMGVGALLGGLAGHFTAVHTDAGGFKVAKAGVVAATLWILGTGGRLAFQVYATHGGGAAITRFSATHGITGAAAWTDALILMALSEAAIRTGILAWRAHAVHQQAPVAAVRAPAPAPPVPAPRRPVLSGSRSIMEGSERAV